MLVATGQITSDRLEGFAFVGELALDGAVRPVTGAHLHGHGGSQAQRRPASSFPRPTPEAAVVRKVEVYGVGSLADSVGIVMEVADFEPVSPTTDEVEGKLNRYEIDFADVHPFGMTDNFNN